MAEQVKPTTALECLTRIKPAVPQPRFLIAWDPSERELWYGLGSGSESVRISSKLKLQTSASDMAFGAKLENTTVQRVLDGSPSTDGCQLLHDCSTLLGSYVHFADQRLYVLLTAWNIGSYLYPMFSHFGYLFFHSALPRSGKTRVEEVLSHLAFEAGPPTNAPTVPTIRDTAAEGRTLVLDTIERWKGKHPEAFSAGMELLDAGFRNGGIVSKMESMGNGKWRRQVIPVFAPYVMAAISRDSLSDTALDRSFVVEMHRKKTAIRKKKYSFDRCEAECRPLRERLYLWALENAEKVAEIYNSRELEAEVDALQLNDRAADIWCPLFAVLRTMAAEGSMGHLKGLACEMALDPDSAEDQRKLKIVRTLKNQVNGSGILVAITTQLEKYLEVEGVRVKSHELHSLLMTWGFTQESVRTGGEFPLRSWRIETARLLELETELLSSAAQS